jgi:uncharacterized protein with ATP-grasp and redox domains
MKYKERCVECARQQGLRIYGIALESLGQQDTNGTEQRLQNELKEELQKVDPALSPAELSYVAIRAAHVHSKCDDPFKALKEENNQLALSLLPDLKQRIDQSDNPLYTACLLSACGNIIDLGIQHSFDIQTTIDKVLNEGFKRDDFSGFQEKIQSALDTDSRAKLMYICDNAGEILFDRLFIEELTKAYPNLMITAVVRKFPVLNDATIDDAKTVGLDQVVPIIDAGDSGLGIILSKAGPRFTDVYRNADVIISKGQANYETLSHQPGPIYFILKAKCEVIAESLGVEKYDAVMTTTPNP